VPASTGAAQATARAVPELAGRFDGIAVRAPVPVGSIADIVFVAGRPATTQEVKEAFRQEAARARYDNEWGFTHQMIREAGEFLGASDQRPSRTL
jgi:glyceraldehyde 3-phosphate dehydrogenase (phosphorylating)